MLMYNICIIVNFLGIIIVNSQNYLHSTIQKFTWGVHASTVIILNISLILKIFP